MSINKLISKNTKLKRSQELRECGYCKNDFVIARKNKKRKYCDICKKLIRHKHNYKFYLKNKTAA